jgi:LPXTG-motif cell wall-anchored protein
MYTIAAPLAAATGGGGGGGAACFIATAAANEAALVVTDWSVSSLFGLLAFVGLLWLGRRRKRR